MAAPDNTLLTTGGSAVVGQREDLANYVSRIDPAETIIYSWCGSGSAKNKGAHDWQTVDLAAPALGTKAEGDTFARDTPKRTTKLTNACEIHSRTYGVSGTAQAVDTAGDTGSLNFQRLHHGLELRKELELMLFKLQAKSTSDPRVTAGLPAFAGTASVGSGGTTSTADGAQALVWGTERALTADLLRTNLKAAWTEGAQISMLFMSAGQKLGFDAAIPIDNIADNNVAITGEGGVITDTVAIWRSAFGDIKVGMDRIMDEVGNTYQWAQQMIIGVDERSTFRPKVCPLPGRMFINRPLAYTADEDAEVVIYEGTIEVPNPKAVMVVGALSDSYDS